MPEPLSAGLIIHLVFFFSELMAFLSILVILSLGLGGLNCERSLSSSLMKYFCACVSDSQGGCQVDLVLRPTDLGVGRAQQCC